MDYRTIRKAGLKMSDLSFGCMRFNDAQTAFEAVRKAIELGVNYFDVAPMYGNGTAEPWLAEGLKGYTDKVLVSAKCSPGNGGDDLGEYNAETGFGIRTADQVRFQMERSMKILGVDHLDIYHLWTTSNDVVFDEARKPGGFLEGVEKAREEGMFDHLGITLHSDSDTIIRFMEAYDFAMVTLPYSLRDTSREKAIRYCEEHGIGVIAMNPIAGGSLAKPSTALKAIATDLGFDSMLEASLRFIKSNTGVTTALNGLTYASQVVEGVDAMAKGMIDDATYQSLRSKVTELYSRVAHLCSGCGYCGECTQGILIPKVFEIYTNLAVPDTAQAAMDNLADLLAENPTGYDPSLCTSCKACETHCPNSIPIAEMMAEAAKLWPK